MDLVQLKRKRGNVKSSLTKFATFVGTYQRGDSKAETELRVRLEKADNLLDRYEEIQDLIEEMDETELRNATESRKEFEDTFYGVISRARNFLQGNSCQSNSVQGCSSHTESIHMKNIHLLALTLPKFSGEYTDWLPFKDAFLSAVHNNDKLTSSEKFRYLRSSLQNEPLNLLAALETSNENYSLAWNMLKDRYENERLIIHNHLKALFDLPNKCWKRKSL
ncbi:uncharacterized protein [Onthophagus taurus]|uniref:uncharacterized protein n=1 Tax=Onthophagus taurus TaxID=166361 RepID=UPI0039BECBD3